MRMAPYGHGACGGTFPGYRGKPCVLPVLFWECVQSRPLLALKATKKRRPTTPPWKRNRFMCYYSVAARCSFQSGHSQEGIRWGTSQNRIDIHQVVIQSRAASMTTLDKLDPSLTGRIRISTMICYASHPRCLGPWPTAPPVDSTEIPT